MPFEEGAEMGLVGEAELVCYFLDGEGCGTKKRFSALHECLLDTFACSHAERFFDSIGDIAGREAELFGIPIGALSF